MQRGAVRFIGWAALLASLALACGPFKRFAYNGIGRDAWQQPTRVVESLRLSAGAQVADLGAGGGYFTWRLAEQVGVSGRVYAVDVDPDMVDYLTEEAQDQGLSQVDVVHATFDDPSLPDAAIDLLLTVNTYHHLSERSDYFKRVRRALRPGGRVAIIDFDDDTWLGGNHTTPGPQIVAELEAAGFRLRTRYEYLERQSFQIFEVAPDAE